MLLGYVVALLANPLPADGQWRVVQTHLIPLLKTCRDADTNGQSLLTPTPMLALPNMA